ncbi:MAG: hypothetical protein ACYCSN_03735 [Acidobacteriaceae bacterium]
MIKENPPSHGTDFMNVSSTTSAELGAFDLYMMANAGNDQMRVKVRHKDGNTIVVSGPGDANDEVFNVQDINGAKQLRGSSIQDFARRVVERLNGQLTCG